MSDALTSVMYSPLALIISNVSVCKLVDSPFETSKHAALFFGFHSYLFDQYKQSGYNSTRQNINGKTITKKARNEENKYIIK